MCDRGAEADIMLGMDEDAKKKLRGISMDNDAADRQEHVDRLKESFLRLSRDMGSRRWSREDLYAR